MPEGEQTFEWFFLTKCLEASVEKCEGSGCLSTGHTDSKRGAKSSQNSKTRTTAS